MTHQESPVWFITGCSTGFGKELQSSCWPGAGVR
jgi:hypothetical protein